MYGEQVSEFSRDGHKIFAELATLAWRIAL